MERWSGRVALVTGASVGIGAALVRKLAECGMKVVGCARNVQQVQVIADELQKAGVKGSVTAMKCDLRKESDIAAMFQQIKASHGAVDVCINNAGLSHNAPLLSGENAEWREVLEVNVLALSICTKESVKTMREEGINDGHIIHISSMSGHRVTEPAINMYTASKFAVNALTEGLRRELIEAKTNIRVTSISPGNVDTEFTKRMYAKDLELQAKKVIPEFKELDSKDIVDTVVYALSAPPHVQVHDILLRPTAQKT